LGDYWLPQLVHTRTLAVRIAACVLVFLFTCQFLCSGCGSGGSSQAEKYTPRETRPYPGDEVQKAKNLRDEGMVLLRKAMDADTQDEKNVLAAEARDRYFFPAQGMLDKLKAEYPEYESQMDSLYQLLNEDIMDAIKISGTGG
jgi:hypothetical protein